MVHQVTVKVGAEDLVLETGRMAKQANGAIYATYGGSAVLTTACCGSSPVEGLDYVPLQVEYNEKYYAAGKIPGGFLKREGRPKDKEILVCRLIDRPMRPLFHKEFGRDIQVVPTVVSADQVNTPDMVAMVAASAAVMVSDIPFEGPVAAVRVASVDGEMVINPTFAQIEASTLDIVVAGTMDGITMVEGGAKEVSEETMLEAITKAEEVIKEICKAQLKLVELAGKEKLPMADALPALENADEVKSYVRGSLEEACFVKGKFERRDAINAVKKEAFAHFFTEPTELETKLFGGLMESLEKEIVRKSILEKGLRTDGRGTEDIRPITCQINCLDRTHGSALFTRGETQSLGVATLGSVSDERIVDDIDGDKSYENFMLHYNFPPFSVGECGRMFTGRREIGHGHLAQRAIQGVLPKKEDFPYTLRVVSEILESNGSSSMATVCSATLSLLNAGVPIRKPVAGIAMGLITDGVNSVILSDILGEEDHLGDMDFKVAGTEDGITAFQMDIKISGVTSDLMKRALAQAKTGRMHILGIMNQTISAPQEEVSEFAPKILTMKIDPEKIGAVIGPGGKVIKSIAEQTGASLDIENDGSVKIFGKNLKSAKAAEEFVKAITEEPEVGKIYQGTVKRVVDFGAFIEILPGKEGLCHISKMSRTRIASVTEVMNVGDQLPVKLVEVDRMGRVNLSYIDAVDNGENKKQYKG